MIDIHNMKYRLTLGMYNTMDCESFWNNEFYYSIVYKRFYYLNIEYGIVVLRLPSVRRRLKSCVLEIM